MCSSFNRYPTHALHFLVISDAREFVSVRRAAPQHLVRSIGKNQTQDCQDLPHALQRCSALPHLQWLVSSFHTVSESLQSISGKFCPAICVVLRSLHRWTPGVGRSVSVAQRHRHHEARARLECLSSCHEAS